MPKKEQKSRIDQFRDGPGSMKIGDESDGEITGMVSVDDEDLYVIMNRAIYQILMADKIDPDRTNIKIPNSNQRVTSSGSDSEIVSRIFLTANTLFNTQHFEKSFSRKPIIDQCLEITKELLEAEKIHEEIISKKEYADSECRQPETRQFRLPAIENLNVLIKSFIQRTEHAAQHTYGLTKIFFDHKSNFFDGFTQELESSYGSEDNFVKYSKQLSEFMKFVRNSRHCIEHPKSDQKLIVNDFALNAKGVLCPPSIEFIHKETPQPNIDVHIYTDSIIKNFVSAIETLIVYIAEKHISSEDDFTISVGRLADNQSRKYKLVNYGYFVKISDKWLYLN